MVASQQGKFSNTQLRSSMIFNDKEWIYRSKEDHYGIYQELSLNDSNTNPVIVRVSLPCDFNIAGKWDSKGGLAGELSLEIPIAEFDEIAKTWTERRHLSKT